MVIDDTLLLLVLLIVKHTTEYQIFRESVNINPERSLRLSLLSSLDGPRCVSHVFKLSLDPQTVVSNRQRGDGRRSGPRRTQVVRRVTVGTR